MSEKRRRWAKWATGSSFLLLLLAVVSLFQLYPSLIEKYDPESNYVVKVGPGQQSDFTISEETILTALRVSEGDGLVAELRLFDEDGLEISGRGPGFLDYDRVGTDKQTIYSPVKIFQDIASGNYTLHNDAQALQLWLVDDGELQNDIDGNPWSYIFYMGCCLGAPIGLVGLILAVMVWIDKRKAPDQFVVIQDGSVILTDMEGVQSMQSQVEKFTDREGREGIPSPLEKQVDSNTEEGWKNWDEG